MPPIPNIDLSTYSIKTKGEFKAKQLAFPKVRGAYENKSPYIAYLLVQNQLKPQNFELYLQAFKHDDLLKVWAKNTSDKKYKLIKTYPICKKSGVLGPKRKEGDKQVPEGYYLIDKLNPNSRFHLSLHVNYPNKSDAILSDPDKPGNLLFVHGKCVSIGCIPILDEPIEELYILCTEAMNNGQQAIPITIFPFDYKQHKISNFSKNVNQETKQLWIDLNRGFDYFELNKTLPTIKFLDNGRMKVVQ